MTATQLGIAIPNFWFAILLVLLFAVFLGWLPAGGFPGWKQDVAKSVLSLILPALSLSLSEIAIAACDLAEVIGAAIALHLLFGIPLPWGVLVTALDVMIVLLLQHKGFRLLEAVVVTLVATVGACFLFEILLARPEAGLLARAVPRQQNLHEAVRHDHVANPGRADDQVLRRVTHVPGEIGRAHV